MTMIQTEGTFTAKVTDAMLTTAKSGSPQIAIVCEVDDEHSDEDGHALTWYGSFAPNALQYTVDALVKALGFSGNGADLWSFLDEVRGKRCRIVTQLNEHNGKTSLRVRWLNPLNAGPSDDEQRKLAAMMAGAIDTYRAGKTGLPPTPTAGDDIPF